jgi:hypothetical protein
LNLTHQEKLAEISKAMIAAAWRRPDSLIIDRPDWFQILTPSSGQFWHNKVLRSYLTEENVVSRVRETIRSFKAEGKGFIWVVSPDSTPANLGEVLAQEGMTYDHAGLGMLTEIDRIQIEDDPRITVEEVHLHNAEEYAKVSCLGWDSPPGVQEELLSDLVRCLLDSEQKTLYYVARFEGRPAASGALLPLDTSGYLLGSSVAPEFRGKGLYRALVKKRFEKLRELKIPVATIQAMATTSAPICRKLGFETVCEVRVFKIRP